MTELLERAIRAVRELTPETQDKIATIILRLIRDYEEEPVKLSPDERAAIEESMVQEARGEFASEEEVRGAWAKYGL